ncbi:type IV secretion system DNA-binding domain-containing protein [Geobacter sulfurreducens]|uniref:type IV secretion system DNA-binding domain-containing protein n=1 Tax=Geobacter sulfurreducens TaxID=35554 RepID=UPI000DBB69B8|nr:type IV secretion system DNA-binding domain-containing protein [Geobacter sulfurreducens]BBA70624.1 Coupling protein TraD [Geobacter sulfurreducens]
MYAKGEAYQGHETWWNSLRMHAKMLLYSVYWGIACQLMVFLLLFIFLGDFPGMVLAIKALIAPQLRFIPFTTNILHRLFAEVISNPADAAANVEAQFHWLKNMFLFSLPTFPVVTFTAIEYFRRRGDAQARPEYIRGAILRTAKEINRLIRRSRKQTDFTIGEVNLRVEDENQHFFTIGRPRQGKTQMLNPIIAKARRRPKAKGVIFDFKGEFWAQFGDLENGDLLFNPLDTRTLGWTIFNDCKRSTDLELMANALIPEPPPDTDNIWVEGCRDIFVSILKYCILHDKRTNRDVWNCIAAPGPHLKAMFEATPGSERGLKHLHDPESKQANCFLTELMIHGKCFEWLPDGPFSVVDWLYNGTGWLFISSFADIRDTLRPATGLLVELLIVKHLAMPEDVNRRIYYFLDEAGALGKINSLEMALNQASGRGASIWLMVQNIGQLSAIYGKDLTEAIVNACGTSVIFSVADPNTAKQLSEKIGDVEYYEKEIAQSYGVSNNRDGENFRQTKRCDKLFLPVEIMQLKKFECIVNLPDFGVNRTKIPYKNVPLRQPPFIIKPEFDLDVIVSEFKELMKKAKEYRGKKTQTEPAIHEDGKCQETEFAEKESELGGNCMELDVDDY